LEPVPYLKAGLTLVGRGLNVALESSVLTPCSSSKMRFPSYLLANRVGGKQGVRAAFMIISMMSRSPVVLVVVVVVGGGG
jgi:hypothetical protein